MAGYSGRGTVDLRKKQGREIYLGEGRKKKLVYECNPVEKNKTQKERNTFSSNGQLRSMFLYSHLLYATPDKTAF